MAAEMLDIEMYHIVLEIQNEAIANEKDPETAAVALGLRKAIGILTGETA